MPAKPKVRKPTAPGPKISTERIAERVSEVVSQEAPELRLEKHWGHEWFVGTDIVVAVGAFAQHVGVEFWRGSTIPDPDHLLEGTGKNLRHVKVRTLEEASSPPFVRLIRRAVLLDQKEPKRGR